MTKTNIARTHHLWASIKPRRKTLESTTTSSFLIFCRDFEREIHFDTWKKLHHKSGTFDRLPASHPKKIRNSKMFIVEQITDRSKERRRHILAFYDPNYFHYILLKFAVKRKGRVFAQFLPSEQRSPCVVASTDVFHQMNPTQLVY